MAQAVVHRVAKIVGDFDLDIPAVRCPLEFVEDTAIGVEAAYDLGDLGAMLGRVDGPGDVGEVFAEAPKVEQRIFV